MSRSLIRVEADETTYNLHIILRFQLELALIDGSLAVDDLPHAWNDGMHRLLGLDVPDDAQGVLQDVHWGAGLIGYFPTYTLGNLMAAQLWETLRADLPDLDAQLEQGDFGPLRAWLRGQHPPPRPQVPARRAAAARDRPRARGRAVPRVPPRQARRRRPPQRRAALKKPTTRRSYSSGRDFSPPTWPDSGISHSSAPAAAA